MYATWEDAYIINAHLNFRNYSVSKYWLFFLVWFSGLSGRQQEGFWGRLSACQEKGGGSGGPKGSLLESGDLVGKQTASGWQQGESRWQMTSHNWCCSPLNQPKEGEERKDTLRCFLLFVLPPGTKTDWRNFIGLLCCLVWCHLRGRSLSWAVGRPLWYLFNYNWCGKAQPILASSIFGLVVLASITK